METKDKLRVLIPHWIEHNQEHADEFRNWTAESDEVAAEIAAAADLLVQANIPLQAALDALGGPLEHDHHHDHHHHHHD